mgnify:CR=1 FL=1
MRKIKIHVFHTGEVCVAPKIAFLVEMIVVWLKHQVSFGKKRRSHFGFLFSSYLIEHPKGTFLVDTGWSRDMSPNGILIKSRK